MPSSLQAVVANFIEEGHFSNHIRRMRKLYAERYQIFHEESERYLKGLLALEPARSGFHTVGHLEGGLLEKPVARAAWEQGLVVTPISRYSIEPTQLNGLVLGFSAIGPREIRAGVRKLAGLLETLSDKTRKHTL